MTLQNLAAAFPAGDASIVGEEIEETASGAPARTVGANARGGAPAAAQPAGRRAARGKSERVLVVKLTAVQLAKDFKLAKGEKLTPVTYLMHKFPEYNYQQVRNMLGRFGLEGHHHEQDEHHGQTPLSADNEIDRRLA